METSCISDLMYKEPKYYILNKPFGIISQFTPEESVHGFLKDLNLPIDRDVYPIGRLDAETEGLLLLSSDKYLVNKILDPKYSHKRTYLAQVEGVPDQADIEKLEKGLTLNIRGKMMQSLPCKASIKTDVKIKDRNPPIRIRKEIPETWVEIVLTEGKYHQVRKMFAAIGFPVLRLIRTSIEGLELGDLEPGKFKEINKFVVYRKLKVAIRSQRTKRP